MINKKVIIYDRGLYTYFAQKLGEEYEKVYYFLPDAAAYPKSDKDDIGTGLPEIERIYDFWKYLDKVDLIVFPDCYDGNFQEWLRKQGHIVYGAGLSEELEMDKKLFYEHLEDIGLAVPFTYLADGLDEALEYLKGKEDKWLKPVSSYCRGDFETFRFVNMRQSDAWFNDLRNRLGQRCKDLQMLIQNPVKAACEIGYDGYCIDGAFPDNAMAGYEIKDRGYIGKVFPVMPKIISGINEKMEPYFEKHGYRGSFTSELRITKSGKVYFIDPTCRVPSPPGELMTEIYSSYAEDIDLIANGEMPKMEDVAEFGAELLLYSSWYENHELCVEFPKDLDVNVKLKNHTKRGSSYYCIPNDNGGYFGAVIATGNSVKECTEKAKDVISQVVAYQLEYDSSIFDKAEEQIASGEDYGIRF